MLESGFSKEGQSQDIQDRLRMSESMRRCSWSRRHCYFFILLVAVIVFFYSTDIKIMSSDWTLDWMDYERPNRVIPPSKSYSNTRHNTSGYTTLSSVPEQTSAAAGITTIASFPQTENITEKSVTDSITPNQTTPNTLVLSQQVTQKTTVKPTPVPYVSPGPYVVEYPSEYHFLINEPKKCEEQKPFVVLMVPVAPNNKEHRDIVRSTWGHDSEVQGKVVKLFFLLGKQVGDGAEKLQEQLLQESKEHKDLIQSDFVDCYKNLTIKTMVMLEWLDAYCNMTSYAMKVDSDTFLNVPVLVSMLTNAPKTNYMTGVVARDAFVLRDPNNKWFLPMDLYPHTYYPPYALGVGYVVSLDLPKKLVAASRHVKALYIEDVYLGLCMQHMGIPPTDPPHWGYFNINPMQYNRCAFSRIIVCLPIENRGRMWLWEDYKKPGPYC